MGKQFPRPGSCYAGLFAFSHGAYREYIQTPLKVVLEKSKKNQFKMYISLADNLLAMMKTIVFSKFNHHVIFE